MATKGDHGEQKDSASHEDFVAFLLAELTNSREMISYHAQRGEKRIDVLLVCLSAIVAGLAILSQARLDLLAWWGALAITSMALTVLSIYSTLFVMSADLHAVHRGFIMRNIRDYFLEHHPVLHAKIMIPTERKDGSIVGSYGNWRISMFVGAFSFGAFIAALMALIGVFGSDTAIVVALGLLVACLCVAVQELFLRRKYSQLERALNTKSGEEVKTESSPVRREER